jgi:hypothetical protein
VAMAQPISDEEEVEPGVRKPFTLQRTPNVIIQQTPTQSPTRRVNPVNPAQPRLQGQGNPPVALRTHCNGTCVCTGSDCTDKWKINNCKDGTATCSNDPETPGSLICSCVKKASTD